MPLTQGTFGTFASARDICTEALTVSGIVADGQTASGNVVNATFGRLNRMLSQWQLQRWLIWHLVENKVIGNGILGGDQNPFLIGPGGMVLAPNGTPLPLYPRPDRIEFAFLRQTIPTQPNNIDYPLEQMFSYEDWANIALKTLGSFPSYFFYDPATPLGKLYVWPVMFPTGLYETHIITKEVLGGFASLTTAVLLPGAYEPAMSWNLARLTRIAFRRPPDPELNKEAKKALNVIRMPNVQVPRLVQPPDLVRPGIYNVFSDNIRALAIFIGSAHIVDLIIKWGSSG
jgi:hypothetical protein